MSQSPFDTIVAPITGVQPAAVAWVRLSGPDSWTIAGLVFKAWPKHPISHKAVFGVYSHGDSGLALPFEQDHSYTGERSVELSIHGSSASTRKVVELCLAEGARMAEPGEFTLRAFLNGRMDLTQAEAVRDTVEARTEAQLRAANMNRKGILRREVSAIRDQVLRVLVQVEASVDFSEEIGDLDHGSASMAISEQIGRLDHLIATTDSGRILRSGYKIAIVGPPNAGKSSLLNALLGEDRSIVTEVPGTTRDYVEEALEIEGLPIVLIDTAGLRTTSDVVESIGIQRTHAIAANADAIWYLYDSSTGWTDQDQIALASFERPVTVLANKSDIAESAFGNPISATTRQGLDSLLISLRSILESRMDEPVINLRHQPLLSQARASLSDCLTSIDNHAPDDLLSVLLNEAASHLGAVTGETASPEMIERIFHDFCVGK